MKTVTTMKCCYSCQKQQNNDNYRRGNLKLWRAECKLLRPIKKTLKKMIWKEDCDRHASHVTVATWDLPSLCSEWLKLHRSRSRPRTFAEAVLSQRSGPAQI